MMMRHIYAAIALGLLAVSPAAAQSGLYIGATAGTSFFFDQEIEDGGADFDVEYDQPGFLFAGLIGYQLTTNMRVEAEISYAFTEGDVTASVLGIDVAENGFDTSVLSGTAGLFLDLWPIGTLIPYVGGGVGYSQVSVNIDGDLSEQDQSSPLVFGEAGLPLPLTPELSVVPAVRFNWIFTEEDIGDGDLFADDLYTTELRFGLRYGF
ncbi:MAG: outer membrane beta-barrel protein [Pseudomonadota bacterium]